MTARLLALAGRVWRWLVPPVCPVDAAFLDAVALAHAPLPYRERIALILDAAPGEIDAVIDAMDARLRGGA